MKFYDGALVSDDELHPLTTRNICLRTQVCLIPRAPLMPACKCSACTHALAVVYAAALQRATVLLQSVPS